MSESGRAELIQLMVDWWGYGERMRSEAEKLADVVIAAGWRHNSYLRALATDFHGALAELEPGRAAEDGALEFDLRLLSQRFMAANAAGPWDNKLEKLIAWAAMVQTYIERTEARRIVGESLKACEAEE